MIEAMSIISIMALDSARVVHIVKIVKSEQFDVQLCIRPEACDTYMMCVTIARTACKIP